MESQDQALAAALAAPGCASPPRRRTRRSACEYRRLGLLEQAFDQFGGAQRLEPAGRRRLRRCARESGATGASLSAGWGTPRVRVYFAPHSAAAHNTWGTLLAASGWLASAQRRVRPRSALDPTGRICRDESPAMSRSSAGQIDTALADCRRARSSWTRNRLSRETTSRLSLAAGRRLRRC